MTATLEAPMVVNGKRPEFGRTPGPAMPPAAPPRHAPTPAVRELEATDWHRIGAIAVGGLVVASVLAVVAAGFAISFSGITAVSEAANVAHNLSWLMPVSIDGAMVTGTAVALVLRYLGRTPWYPYLVVGLGVVVSVALNALHATLRDGRPLDTTTAGCVSAIPAVMLALSVHQVAVLIQAVTGRRSDTPDAAAAVPATVADTGPVIEVTRVSAPDTQPPAVSAPDSGQDQAPARTPQRRPTPRRPAASDGGQDTAARIAAYLAEHPGATQAEIANALGVSDRTVRRNTPPKAGQS